MKIGDFVEVQAIVSRTPSARGVVLSKATIGYKVKIFDSRHAGWAGTVRIFDPPFSTFKVLHLSQVEKLIFIGTLE